ncbi:MAG: hypothetical protein ACMUHY_06015, partial [Thermoplasmatota archaeon]
MLWKTRVLFSLTLMVVLLAPYLTNLVPSGDELAFPGQEPGCQEKAEVLGDPPASGYYDGEVLHVGGFGPGNYSTIQSALDDSADRDRIWVYSGAYSEVLTVDNEVWINGATGTKLVNPGG